MKFLLDYIFRIERKFYMFNKRIRLKNKNMTVFSSNCNGAYMLHDLGCPLNSPTVNIGFYPEQYFQFLNNPGKYLSSELNDTGLMDGPFWVGQIDDITVRVGHYSSFAEAQAAWKRRAKG